MEDFPVASKVCLSGRYWCIDSWDGETARAQIIDEDGNILEEWTQRCQHPHNDADENF
jgi:hypothetical protein